MVACYMNQKKCKNPDYDEREGKRYLEPEKGCGVRDVKKTERGTDKQWKGLMASPVTENAEQYNDDAQYQIPKKNRIPLNRHKKYSYPCTVQPVFRFYYHNLNQIGLSANEC